MDSLTPRRLSREQFLKLTMGLTTIEEIVQKRLERDVRRIQARIQTLYERRYETYSDQQLMGAYRMSRRWLDTDFHDVVPANTVSEYWAIRKVLARRGHVPRKPEQVRNRKELARVNRGQSKSKNR